MIGLDTNVLVRYIMQDDARQSPLASRLVESLTAETPGFVPLVAVVELAWVLLSCYGLNRAHIVTAFEALLRTKEIVLENAEVVWRAVRVYRGGSADFADCLVERSAAAAGCERTMTFDRGAAKNCAMTLIH
ncbi:type II toxin-antitoxin system VapC family toxin [Ramlibacter sp. 2FC]|uniref:PIN domain-containing protein n=1 Tax=Ramlibacter sp. 2FC TaxID=2502188 RepID=UPI0010F58308|nr:type II toxin-antitoxin system VapC family toxin [Ramlibacter sp. 2FC]